MDSNVLTVCLFGCECAQRYPRDAALDSYVYFVARPAKQVKAVKRLRRLSRSRSKTLAVPNKYTMCGLVRDAGLRMFAHLFRSTFVTEPVSFCLEAGMASRVFDARKSSKKHFPVKQNRKELSPKRMIDFA